MGLKKKIPLMALIAIIGMCFMVLQPASAAHTTEVKAYQYDPYDPPGTELGTDWYIKKGDYIDVAATLHVDGGNPQWFRYIHFYVYDPTGNQIFNEERNSGFGGLARCWINSRDWNSGNYTLQVTYWGNDDDGYPRADKYIALHIV